MTREELLKKIDDKRAEIMALIVQVPEKNFTGPALPNGWTIKDLLAHLGAWEQRTVYLYGRLSAGLEVEDRVDDPDTFNAMAYRLFRDMSLDEIRAKEQVAFLGLREIAETAPEEHLFNSAQFPYTEGKPFQELINWNSYGHYDEHIPDLKAWLEGLEKG